MVVPIYAGLERLPDSLLDASSDLGAHFGFTFRKVVLPLLMPAIVAGSVFTFSLSLGDYIAVDLVGGNTQVIGSVVFDTFSADLPFAAAFAVVPVIIMVRAANEMFTRSRKLATYISDMAAMPGGFPKFN